jgi:hypothetical protein
MKRLALAGAVLCALCGCSPRASTGRPADACTLLPRELAESVLDVKLGDPKSQAFGENPRQTVISNCQYVAAAAQPVGLLSFTIRVGSVPESSINPAEVFISTMKQTFGQRYDLKKLTGLGDGAVWDGSLKQLTVFKGTSTYVWTSPGATKPDLEDKLVSLAKQTMSKV